MPSDVAPGPVQPGSVGPGPVALVGSGEYLDAMTELEGRLIDGRPPRYVQIPTAAAPEGEHVLARWLQLGADQAERLGVEQVAIVARDRHDADDPDLAAQVAGAGLIYLSGGNPGFLASTLRDTALWRAIVAAWQGGAALAGCSAGCHGHHELGAVVAQLGAGRRAGARPGAAVAGDPALRPVRRLDALTDPQARRQDPGRRVHRRHRRGDGAGDRPRRRGGVGRLRRRKVWLVDDRGKRTGHEGGRSVPVPSARMRPSSGGV